MTIHSRGALGRRPATATLGDALIHAARALRERLALWAERRRSRRALERLPPHMLKDIGLEPWRAEVEWRKPFWR